MGFLGGLNTNTGDTVELVNWFCGWLVFCQILRYIFAKSNYRDFISFNIAAVANAHLERCRRIGKRCFRSLGE